MKTCMMTIGDHEIYMEHPPVVGSYLIVETIYNGFPAIEFQIFDESLMDRFKPFESLDHEVIYQNKKHVIAIVQFESLDISNPEASCFKFTLVPKDKDLGCD